jgi:putative phosphoribosyl transferase
MTLASLDAFLVGIPAVGLNGRMIELPGRLSLPPQPGGIVLFAHGSGSNRLSPRNLHVAIAFHEAGLGTLLFDLLTDDEAADRGNVFDIQLLAERIREAVQFVASVGGVGRLPLGLFGASTGAGAALVAAAGNPRVKAVVSRGGRPDLAGDRLAAVTAPTLLIVGGEDRDVLDLNRQAFDSLRCEKQLAVVPRATHLFDEPGTLDEAAQLAAEWFQRWLLSSAERTLADA